VRLNAPPEVSLLHLNYRPDRYFCRPQESGGGRTRSGLSGCWKTSIRPSAKACGILESAAYSLIC